MLHYASASSSWVRVAIFSLIYPRKSSPPILLVLVLVLEISCKYIGKGFLRSTIWASRLKQQLSFRPEYSSPRSDARLRIRPIQRRLDRSSLKGALTPDRRG
jgi:hypothetical protein